MLNLSANSLESIDKLLNREEVVMDRSVIEEYVSAGYWGEKSAIDFLRQHVVEKPHELALIDDEGHRYTWTQFDEITDAFALNLLKLGFEEGDFIALQLPNWSEFFITLMGAIKVKVIPVNLHLTYRLHDLSNVLSDCKARGLVSPGLFRQFNYTDLAKQVKEKLPHLKYCFTVRGYTDGNSIPFESMLRIPEGAHRNDLLAYSPNGFDPLLSLTSSGTTGKPKLIFHIHNSFLYPGKAYKEMLGLKPQNRWAVITPVGHSTAVSQFFWGLLYQGSPLILLAVWNAERFAEIIEREKVTHSIGATPLYSDLVNLPNVAGKDLSSLELLIYGGAPMPAHLVRKLNDVLGCDVVPFYGYSEGTGHTTCEPGTDIEVVSESVGYTLIGSQTKLVDQNTGREVEKGQPGEFWAKGPNIAVGYFFHPEITKKLMTPDGYFKTGDVLYEDESGYFHYMARNDDIINRGGQKIDPKEVEDVLFTHPKIANVVLIEKPDERLGAIAVAFVVPKGGEQITLEEIRSFLEEKGLAKWKWPERLVIKDFIPVNPSGKIMRFVLREEAKSIQ